MFGNKIVISREQYDVVKGVSKISTSKEYDVSYGIIEFGISILISMSFDKASGDNKQAFLTINSWKAEPEAVVMGDAMMTYLNHENKKEYVTNRDFFSFIGVNTIRVAPEQKRTVAGLAKNTGFSERAISHIVFESGVTFMMLASGALDEGKVKETLSEFMGDDDVVMKVANELRRCWEASQ